MGWLIAIILVLGFAWLVKSAMDQQKIIANDERTFRATRGGWELFISPIEQKVIGLSRATGEIVLGTTSSPKQYRLNQIASVEVLKDGASISSTNRGSQLAGAAIGGLAFGGIGLLVGGLSGSKKNRATVQTLAIKIIVDDPSAPYHTIKFFESPDKNGTDAKSKLLLPATAQMERIHALLVTALKNIEPETTRLHLPSSTDEISRLWELKLAGALTQEEFMVQKAQLLSAPTQPDKM